MPKGVYDHTKVNTNTEAITALNKAYSAELKGYKQFAAAIRSRAYDIDTITSGIDGMIDYIEKCSAKGEPATSAGLILASGLNRNSFYKAKNGEYDHIQAAYMLDNNISLNDGIQDNNGILRDNKQKILSPISEIIEKCYLYMESDLQRRSLTDKSMARTTGAIFNLKAVFNYNDKPEPETRTVHNTLILNTNADQAAEAMKLLCKDTKE